MRPPYLRTTVLLAATTAVLGPLALAACGGGATGSAGGTVPADPDLVVIAQDIKFDKKAYTAPAGEVRIKYDSQGQQVHSLLIQDASGENLPDFRLQVPPGKAVGGAIQLAAGTYTMVCDIPGHEAAGMVATLTVG